MNQKALQLDKARGLSQQIAIYTESLQRQVQAIAHTLEVDAGQTPFAQRVTRIKDQGALERYLGDQSRFIYVSVVDATGNGAQSGCSSRSPSAAGPAGGLLPRACRARR